MREGGDSHDMTDQIALVPEGRLSLYTDLPAIVSAAGGNARFAYDEFFAGEENTHTERVSTEGGGSRNPPRAWLFRVRPGQFCADDFMLGHDL